MSCIGIDLGTSDAIVAYVGRGTVDIVQNEVSQRKTPSLVGFTDVQRLLGDQAMAQIKSNFRNTCRNFKHILGRQSDDPGLEDEKFWALAQLDTTPEGDLGFRVTYKNEERVFSCQQITAAFLTKLVKITEQWCKSKVAECVISVPSYFTDVHRQALLDAASIAGVRCLRVFNEYTAVALAYGIFRSNDFDPEQSTNVAFCSMGHSTLSVSIVKFVKGKLEVVAEESDRTCGGRDIDKVLMQHCSEAFKKKTSCDAIKNTKARFKLEDGVQKVKKVLSTVGEGTVNIECLMEDEDLHVDCLRSDMEEACKPLMDKITGVLDRVVAKAGLPVEDIHYVEIIGGSCRVPFFCKLVAEKFGKTPETLSRTLNADEAVARGCALQAAILSPSYKVRDFVVEDRIAHGIQVGYVQTADSATISTEGVEEEATAGDAAEGQLKMMDCFPSGSVMGKARVIKLKRQEPFDIVVEYKDPESLPYGVKKDLGTYRIELPKQDEPKLVHVKVSLSLHGTFSVSEAMLLEEETYEETTSEKREIKEEEKPAEGETKDAENPQADTPAEEKKPETEAEAGAEAPENSEAKADEKTDEKPEEKKEPKYEWVKVTKQKKRKKITNLTITRVGVPGIPPQLMTTLQDVETAMAVEAREVEEREATRNELESFILNTRRYVSEGEKYSDFISPDDRDKYVEELTKAEDWIYDHFDDPKLAFIEKLEEIAPLGRQVAMRHDEHEARGEAVSLLQGVLSEARLLANSPDEKYSHIAAEKKAEIVTDCDAAEAWLGDLQRQQGALPKHVDPAFKAEDLRKRSEEVKRKADTIMSEPKPKPPTPPKETKEDKPEKPAEGDAKPEGAGADEPEKPSDAPPSAEDLD
mmetsp:Transcript_9216/g.22146  ORF Transcript_9216/g.22146 Transcript_9216/m.22146 type:complete len:865 (+) Transcript_9216:68-2662(+)